MREIHNKLSQDEVIQRIKEFHGDCFDLSKLIYINSKTKVLIGCKKHEDIFWYETTPSPLFKGTGCPKCGVDKIWKNRKRITTEDFIQRSVKIHTEKYDYSLSKYVSQKDKLIVRCKIHGNFNISPNNHLNGKGCKECGLERSKKSRLKGLEYYLIKSRLYHGNKYNYCEVVYLNSRKKVKITCPIHGEFYQSLQNHSIGHGCEKCGHDYRSENHPRKLSLEIFQKRCSETWGDLYDISGLKDYKNNSTKFNVICKKHGNFTTTPNQLMTNHGCIKCGLERISESQRIEYDEFLEMKVETWGDTYVIKKEDYGGYQSFKVYCKIHDFYWITNGSNFLKGHGCRRCGVTISKGESRITELLLEKNVLFLEQYKFIGMENKRGLRCDFYLSEYNIVIEFNGRQHYESIEFFGGLEGFKLTQYRDGLKQKYCQENDINFEIIKHDESVEDRLKNILELYEQLEG
jgi:hypothetical protein